MQVSRIVVWAVRVGANASTPSSSSSTHSTAAAAASLQSACTGTAGTDGQAATLRDTHRGTEDKGTWTGSYTERAQRDTHRGTEGHTWKDDRGLTIMLQPGLQDSWD